MDRKHHLCNFNCDPDNWYLLYMVDNIAKNIEIEQDVPDVYYETQIK